MKEALLPSTLYKYYPASSLEHIFRYWTIRFTPAVAFNDPFECLPHVISIAPKEHLKRMIELHAGKIIKEETAHLKKKKARRIQKLLRAKNNLNEFSEGIEHLSVNAAQVIRDKFYEQASKQFGIFCLTEEKINLLMWSHYANSHIGFVVGFEMESDFFKNGYSLPKWKPRKINYVQERPSKFFSDFNSDMKEFFYTKGDIWKYENEWRMIAPLELPLAWVEGKPKGVHPLPKKSVSEVIFGARISDEEVRLVCQIIKQQPDCEHIRLQRTKLHESRYELVLEDIRQSFWAER